MPQQMQLQQIQIQPSGLTGQAQLQAQQQTAYVSQDTHQQIQNQLIQSHQIAAMQQQAQNNLNASHGNAPNQQLTIQQPKQQHILIGQHSAAQSQASMENRPIMTMVSIGGGNSSAGSNTGNNTISTLNAIQSLGSPMNSPQHLTIQPPPNPLAAMTSLSYSATPTTILTNSSSNMAKDDKNATKHDDTQKLSGQNTSDPAVLISTSTTNGTTVTTVANGSITISSATSTPVTSLTSLATINKPTGKLTFPAVSFATKKK